MALLKHELYKILARKSTLIAIGLFTVLFLITFMGNRAYGNYTWEAYKIYKSYEGPVTEEKVKMAVQDEAELRKNLATSKEINGVVYTFLPREGNIRSVRNESIIYADQRLTSYMKKVNGLNKSLLTLKNNGKANSYEYRQKSLEINMLKKLNKPRIALYFAGWGDMIDFVNTTAVIIISLLILLGLTPVFSQEYATGVDSLILSSRHGKGKIISAKITASIIYVTSITLFFAVLSFITCALSEGLVGGDNPVQNLLTYFNSPYHLTIRQYFFYQFLIHVLGSVAFGLFVLFISSKSKSPLVTFFGGGIFFGIPLFIESFVNPQKGILAFLVQFSYGRLMAVKDLINQFKTYNIAGHPLLYQNAVAIFFTIVSGLVLFLTYRNFRNHQVN